MPGEGGRDSGGDLRARSTVITKILNFTPNRALTFTPSRKLSFDAGRELLFDPSRTLSFQAWRQMPFGRAGVFFRGYVCPSCRRVALPGATNCQWCKATFDEPMFYIRDDIAKDIREWKGIVSTATCAACGMRSPVDSKFCIECGAAMATKPALQSGGQSLPTRQRTGGLKRTAKSRVVR